MEDHSFDNKEFSSLVEKKQLKLQRIYDNFVFIDNPSQIIAAKRILSRIGIVDFEVEGLTTLENQRDLSIKFHWGHNHNFNTDLVVSGRMGDRHVNLMAQFLIKYGLDELYFQGKEIIDVGCWTGGTTLLLKAMGATHILALEEVQKYAQATNDLVNEVYGQVGVQCEGTNLFDLQTNQKFDIAYFPGVVYHLSDPVLGLRRLFNALKDGGEIFVETMGIDSPEPICQFHGNRQYQKSSHESAQELNRGGWNWFVPSPTCLSLWMQEAGFSEVDCFYSQVSRRVFGYGKRTEFVEITRAGLSHRDIE